MLDLLLAVLAFAPAATAQTSPAIGTEAVLPFLSSHRIRDFEADPLRVDGVYIQDTRRNWYYARTIGPCTDLRFARAIGVDTHGSRKLDRRAELLVRDSRCGLESFTHSGPPPASPTD